MATLLVGRRSISVRQAWSSRNASNSLRKDLIVIEFDGTALRNQSRGYGELQEILKFYVAGAIENTGRGVVDGANTTQTEREDDCVGAKAAQSEESGDAMEPVIHLRCWASRADPRRGTLSSSRFGRPG